MQEGNKHPRDLLPGLNIGLIAYSCHVMFMAVSGVVLASGSI